MKNIIVGLSILIIVIAALYVASVGSAFQGGEAGKIIKDFKSIEKSAKKETKSIIEEDKLKALKDKAGAVSTFKVSKNYKSKCASCHGVQAEGILGPKLFDKDEEYIYKALIEYKSGRRENAIMKGLLLQIEEPLLLELSKEIGSFKTRVK